MAAISFRLQVVGPGGWTIQTITRDSGGRVYLHGVGSAGASYAVERSDLTVGSPWLGVGGVMVGADGSWDYVDIGSGDGRVGFYRLVVP